ncbi:MAG: ATP-grasp domain-containing protein [Methylobacillus sp.]|nr:ATP-grasp domain-containing protein [Methylobacillus sp.]
MKIFVCEFVTGGGLYREPLPSSLAQEGALMLNAVMSGLSRLPDIEIVTTHDARLAASHARASVKIMPEQDVWAIWEQCMREADAVWPIAPESDGVLLRLCELAMRHGKLLLASHPDAIRVAASKIATCKHLVDAGIPVVTTCTRFNLELLGNGACVVKPDDGTSGEGSRVFENKQALSDWLSKQQHADTLVIQSLEAGIPASISMLCMNGEAWLLSCNRQRVECVDESFCYRGSVLNDLQSCWSQFDMLAKQVARALPGLAGYIGIDVIIGENTVRVLEINPRLTTSYAGLEQAIGRNPAELILNMFYNGGFSSPPLIERNIVEVRLNE